MAEWMIDHGSDVHQGGDGPLMRAALRADRIPMMELLVSRRADVNALWSGFYPIIFAPCESVQPLALKWLLEHGANPTVMTIRNASIQAPPWTSSSAPTDGQSNWPRASIFFSKPAASRATTRPPLLSLLRGQLDRLAEQIDADPALLHRRFPKFDFGSTGGRSLKLQGAMLLHVAAEYGNVEAAKLLLDRGADVNARALIDPSGVGGQTPIFHAVTQFDDWGLPVAKLLIDCGADLSVRVRLPGHYERPDEVVECTPLGYALLFPDSTDESKTVSLLRERGAAT